MFDEPTTIPNPTKFANFFKKKIPYPLAVLMIVPRNRRLDSRPNEKHVFLAVVYVLKPIFLRLYQFAPQYNAHKFPILFPNLNAKGLLSKKKKKFLRIFFPVSIEKVQKFLQKN